MTSASFLIKLLTSVAVSFFTGFTIFSEESFTNDSAILLQPESPLLVHVHPNAIYEVLIPISSLNSYESYQIDANCSETDENAETTTTLIKRKVRETSSMHTHASHGKNTNKVYNSK